MKALLLGLCCSLIASFSYAETLAERASTLIASADSAGIRGEMAKKEEEVVISDSKWIRRVSEVVATAPISGSVSCMCAGWRTVYFYKNGELVISVAAIHGNQLRIYSKKGGGDFPIDEAHWKAVKAVLDAPKEANQPPEPTRTSAGLRIKPWGRVAHL